MKRFLTIGAFLFLLVMLVACTQYDAIINEPDGVDPYEEESPALYEQEQEECHTLYEEELDAVSWVEDEINFSSVEDFLNAYVIASAGEDIAHLISEWYEPYTGATIASSVANVNFTSLEAFYLPIGIPEDFELWKIRIYEEFVSFILLHPDDMVSEDAIWDAIWSQRVFRFGFYRWDVEDSILIDAMLEQSFITEEDLVNGRYQIREHEGIYVLNWVSDRTRFSLHVPRMQLNARGEVVMAAELDGVLLDDPYELVSFAETVTLDLRDTRAVEAMIAELAARR